MAWWLAMSAQLALAQEMSADLEGRIHSTRASISATERSQREALSQLFVINQRIKDIARRNARLNEKLMSRDADVRALAQDVQGLETKSGRQKELLNKRLRQLYHDRGGKSMQWIFTAQTPLEMDRARRFLKRMVDNDHKRLKLYLADLRELHKKRERLKGMVAQLLRLQKDVRAQENELAAQMREKSRLLADLKKSKDSKISELKDLRSTQKDGANLAFFERKGALRAPVEAKLAREFGTYVDPVFRFRLMHKGLFYAADKDTEVRSVHDGRVVLAARIPGYGRTVILDHGDNYYSVYAFCSSLKVREGASVREGDLIARSGEGSPLFGPGLHFEIRHFTDAVDPRTWIKEPGIRTAHTD